MAAISFLENRACETTQSNRSWRIPAIDGLRCLAMYLVFSYHMWMFAGEPKFIFSVFGLECDLLAVFQTFPSGVDLFMVLSGFCLFLPLVKSEATLAKWKSLEFFKRRVLRICPAYYASIAYAVALPFTLAFVFQLLHHPAHYPKVSLWQIISHCLFLQTFFVETWAGFCGPLWSLGVEAQFYLLFPFAISLYKRFGFKTFLIIVASSVVYRFASSLLLGHQRDWNVEFLYSINFIGRWMQFGLGMFVAWFVTQFARQGKRVAPIAGLSLIAGSVIFYTLAFTWIPSKYFPSQSLLLGLAYSLLCISICLSSTFFSKVLSCRLVTWLGYISFSIYVLHQDTAWYISEFCKKFLQIEGIPLFLLLNTVAFAVVVAFGYLFFLVFEKPFLENRTHVT